MNKKCVGILGGMGPEATAQLFWKIIKKTPATCDQEHLHIIIDNNPAVPDRTAYLMGKGPSPLPVVLEGLRQLEKAGVDLIAIPCNTIHYFIKEIKEASRAKVIDLIQTVTEATKESIPDLKTIGIMATRGTLMSGLYQQEFLRRGIESITPDQAQEQRLMEVIYTGIKGRRGIAEVREDFESVAKELIERGSQGLILGCTELGIGFGSLEMEVPLIDSIDVLAEVVVKEALKAREE